MDKFAIIVAGGMGTRMGSTLPKQFMLLKGKPVLMHTLQRFYEADPEAIIILVLPDSQQHYWRDLCRNHSFDIRHMVVSGGNTRFSSVRHGLEAIEAANGLVAVHDGVRPLVPMQVIQEAYAMAAEKGSAVVTIPMKDSVRELLPGTEANSRAIDRSRMRIVQTPQVFRISLLREAFAKAPSEDFTDDASVAEAAGHPIHLLEGSYLNIKITTPEDLILAEALIQG